MSGDAKSLEADLAEVLARFDEDDKDVLGEELIESLGLDPGRNFTSQISKRLGRELNKQEAFKLDVIYRAFTFHAESNEEEEE